MASEGSQPKLVALIAHDGKKDDIAAFATSHRDKLAAYRLVGTATTARLLREKVGLEVESMLSGPLGGDVQIAARIVTGEIAAVLFFVDPLYAHPHEPDIQSVQRACNVHNVPLATNVATADLILSARAVSGGEAGRRAGGQAERRRGGRLAFSPGQFGAGLEIGLPAVDMEVVLAPVVKQSANHPGRCAPQDTPNRVSDAVGSSPDRGDSETVRERRRLAPTPNLSPNAEGGG